MSLKACILKVQKGCTLTSRLNVFRIYWLKTFVFVFFTFFDFWHASAKSKLIRSGRLHDQSHSEAFYNTKVDATIDIIVHSSTMSLSDLTLFLLLPLLVSSACSDLSSLERWSDGATWPSGSVSTPHCEIKIHSFCPF